MNEISQIIWIPFLWPFFYHIDECIRFIVDGMRRFFPLEILLIAIVAIVVVIHVLVRLYCHISTLFTSIVGECIFLGKKELEMAHKM